MAFSSDSSSEPSSFSNHLHSHRQRFPALANKAYFNYGGQGPMCHEAIAAMHQAHEFMQTAGPFSREVNGWVVTQANRIKQVMAQELGVTPDTLTLTEDVSVGCNIPPWGIDWRSGDHLLLTDCEHPGIIAAALELQRRFGIEITTCPLSRTLNAGDPTALIAQFLQPHTRLVVLSHILWNTGQVLPLAEIVPCPGNSGAGGCGSVRRRAALKFDGIGCGFLCVYGA
jgi:L-cysteine/cystine lyase